MSQFSQMGSPGGRITRSPVGGSNTVYGLSAHDRDTIQRALDIIHRLPVNLGGQTYYPPEESNESNTYIALIPGGGLPARSGTTPGSADCEIYILLGGILTDAGFTQTVYNLATSAVSAGGYVSVSRDKNGTWLSAQPGGGTSTYGLESAHYRASTISGASYTASTEVDAGGNSWSAFSNFGGATLSNFGPSGGSKLLVYDGSTFLTNNLTGVIQLTGTVAITFTNPLPTNPWFKCYASLGGASVLSGQVMGQVVTDMVGTGSGTSSGKAYFMMSPQFAGTVATGDIVSVNTSANFDYQLVDAFVEAVRVNDGTAM